MFNKINSKGFTFIEILVTGTIGMSIFLAYVSNTLSSRRAINSINKKIAAEAYASELLEIFRSMNSNEVKSYFSQNPISGSTKKEDLYKLCSNANFNKLNGTSSVSFPDPIAELPKPPGLDSLLSNRSYQLQLIDVSSMKTNSSACHKTVLQIIPSANERFFFSVEVAWGKNRKDRVVLSTVIPDPLVFPGPSPGPVSICPGGPPKHIPNGASARGYINKYYGKTIIPDTGKIVGAPLNTSQTAQKICELLGYDNYLVTKVASYSSCGDNVLGYWNGTDWIIQSACKKNQMVDGLTCSCKSK